MWGKVRLYFAATVIAHNLSTSSHATLIEFTHIDYHLGEHRRQKNVVDLASRIPSLAFDTAQAPESPRAKKDRDLPEHKFSAIRRKACFSGVHSILSPFPYLTSPN